jgi:spermidine synthase
MKRLEIVTSPYNRVEVWQNNAGRIDLEVSGATHATWHPTKILTGHAWDAITAGVVSHPGAVDSLLLLGLGGGTCLRQLRCLLPHARMTAVEIDPEMVRLAQTYMQLDDLGVEVIESDAFDVLSTTDHTADVVIDDLYHARGDDVERPKAVSPSMLRTLCRHLNPGGTLVMNFVVGPGHDTVFQQACSSYRSVFPNARRIIPPLSHNEVLVGGTGSVPLAGPSELKNKGGGFPGEWDVELWKDLRTLKLR